MIGPCCTLHKGMRAWILGAVERAAVQTLRRRCKESTDHSLALVVLGMNTGTCRELAIAVATFNGGMLI